MASSPKKKAPAKKKTPAPKKAPAKKPVSVKTPVVVKVVPAPKKKAPAKKKTPAPKKATIAKKIAAAPQKEVAPKKTPKSEPQPQQNSLLTTALAVLIVAFVVLGWYIYSRQTNRMQDQIQNAPDIFDMDDQADLPPPAPVIQVAPSVKMTSEMQDILRILPTQLLIEPDDVLESVSVVADVALLRSQNPTFYKNTVLGDYVLQFKKQTVLFRSDMLQVINVEPVVVKK